METENDRRRVDVGGPRQHADSAVQQGLYDGRAGTWRRRQRLHRANPGRGVLLRAGLPAGTRYHPRLHQQVRLPGVSVELRVVPQQPGAGAARQRPGALLVPGRLGGQRRSVDEGAGAPGRRRAQVPSGEPLRPGRG